MERVELSKLPLSEVEGIGTRSLLVLFEANGTDRQLQKLKALLGLLTGPKGVPQDELLLVKVLQEAVLVRSVKLVEKGFPLLYFIQTGKFLGYAEACAGSTLELHLRQQSTPKEDVVDRLRTFFRGCVVLANPDLVQALRTMHFEEKMETTPPLEVGLGSSLVENAMWSVKWGLDSAWNYASSIYSSTPAPKDELTTQMPNQAPHNDFAVLRLNWYGRAQKRIYRFWDDYFERIDPEGSKTGQEIVKASYKYSDVSKITIENGADVAIYFRDQRLSTQWIQTQSDGNSIISMICSRASWTAPIVVVRNMEVKMEKKGVSTVRIINAAKVISPPQWHKDGLSLAFQDEIGWKSLNLELIDFELNEWMARDIVHHATKVIAGEITCPIGNCAQPISRAITGEQLAKDYYSYECNTTSYPNASGLRTQHAGLLAETMDVVGSNSMLFLAKATEFNGKWQLQHQKLHLFDNKCSVPIISPDEKFVAFLEDNTGSLIIHKVDFLEHAHFMNLSEHEIDLEETLFTTRDRAPPAIPKKKLTPTAPPQLAEVAVTPVQKNEKRPREKLVAT